MSLQVYSSRSAQAEALGMLVADQLHAAIEAQGHASLAVPGGTTPAPFMQALARTRLDWLHVRITLTDERQVAADHERSNALLLRSHLLDAVPQAHFQPLFDAANPAGWLAAVEQQLQATLLPLDVCVLGMGADGHFASLFPAAEQLEAGLAVDNKAAVMAITAANIPEPRISLTLAALLTARHIHLLISGEEKLQVLQQAQARLASGSERQLPIEALLQAAGERIKIHYAP
ncbi:MAG: 6-phosphogluconolactonase [Thiolinea sp.]